jgi:DNA (cytosine-5)-methyltransferase 1
VKRKTRIIYKVYAVDLFCGAGGLTNGLEKSGIDVRLGVDTDPVCEYPYTENNKAKFLLKSVENLDADELAEFLPKTGFRLLAGCAPCQTFSMYNQKANATDKRWWLLSAFSDLVRTILPELVTMENVPKLEKQNVFIDFVKTLKSKDYHIYSKVVNCSDYGLPQYRPRLVLLASRLGPISLLTPKQLRWKTYTVRDKIGGLTPLEAGEVAQKDPLHQACNLSDLNLRRIRASTPGGTWRDWDDDIVANCHKKITGRTYPSVYGRMSWDKPAPTITTQFYGFGNGRFGHPEQDRAISLREGAILQSFPKSYKFVFPGDPIHKKVIGRLIGNAVPVKLGKAIGKSIVKHVEDSVRFGKTQLIGR